MEYAKRSLLVRTPNHIVRHRLQKSQKCCLIISGNGPELRNYPLFNICQTGVHQPLAGEHKHSIYPQRRNTSQIRGIGVARSALVAALGISVNPSGLGQILLAQIEPNAFLAQAISH